jgi:hypothetical protein
VIGVPTASDRITEAEQVTVVAPTGNVRPLVWSQLTASEAPPTSVAVGLKNVTTAPNGPVASVVIGAGTFWNDGGGTVTVTWNDTGCERFPAASWA